MSLIVDCAWQKRSGNYSVDGILAEAQRAKRIEKMTKRKRRKRVMERKKRKRRKNKTCRFLICKLKSYKLTQCATRGFFLL